MKNLYIAIFIFLYIVISSSCKKEAEPVYRKCIFQFSNLLEQDIDILYLSYGTTPQNVPTNDTVFFKIKNIEHNNTTEEYEYIDFANPVKITLVIDYIYYAFDWTNEDALVSNTTPQLREVMPEGKYEFAISNLDTINNTFNFVLVNFEEI